MSKITNPSTESSVTCGFFNSIGDRKYDAKQMSAIFDGVITDGIFATIGTCFVVNAGTGNTVNVGIGKAWFNHTWTLNDAILPVVCDDAEILLKRIDAIVIEVNESNDIRDNFIKFVKGTPASSPRRPEMINTEFVHQYPLCYIERAADSKEIVQANITNMVGSKEAPFVTGILQTVSLEELLGQWQDELDRFVASEKNEIDQFIASEKNDINAFMSNEEATFNKYMADRKSDYESWYAGMISLMEDAVSLQNEWTTSQQATIITWFNHMKEQLSTDAAANLQMQLDESEVRNILINGLADGTKTFSDDGSVITTVDSAGRKLVKTFTNNFLTSTSILTDKYGGELGRLVKNTASDGSSITSEITIF